MGDVNSSFVVKNAYFELTSEINALKTQHINEMEEIMINNFKEK
jgi:hypothetical protein